ALRPLPRGVGDLREVEPDRAVGEQLATLEVAGEEPLAEREPLVLVELVQAGASPGRLGALNDEGAPALVERVRMHLEEAVLGLAKDEREGVEDEVGAEPGVLAPFQ